MKKIALINPINFLGAQITKLLVWVNRYNLGSSTVSVHWMLTTDDTSVNVKDGDVVLSGDIVENWGTDDAPIFMAVADLIGVTVLEIVEE